MHFQKYHSKEHLCLYYFKNRIRTKRQRTFYLKLEMRFFVVEKLFLKLKFQILFFGLFLNVKGSFMPILIISKILIFRPSGIFSKMKTLMPQALACCLWVHRNFGFGILKSYLIFGYLTCSKLTQKNAPLLLTAQ